MTEIKPSKEIEYVEPTVTVTVLPFREARKPEPEDKTFTRESFEDALDKVSRPLKGRLAHVPYSSDDLIREKREEAELEDRPS
jgi:hypothetical protein